jgi:hypothetical protein
MSGSTNDMLGHLRLGKNLYLSTSSPTLSVGDGTGSPVLVMSKSDAGTAALQFNSNSVLRGAVSMNTSENILITRYGLGGDVRTQAVFDDNVYLPGTLFVSGANDQIIVGDGTGTPAIRIAKTDAGTGSIYFDSGGRHRAKFELAADESFYISSYDSAGTALNTFILQSNGITYCNNTFHSNGTSGGHTMRGADVAVTLSVQQTFVELKSTSGTKAVNMGSGWSDGQTMTIVLSSRSGGSYTLACYRYDAAGTITLDATGEGCHLVYDTSYGWKLFNLIGGATFA